MEGVEGVGRNGGETSLLARSAPAAPGAGASGRSFPRAPAGWPCMTIRDASAFTLNGAPRLARSQPECGPRRPGRTRTRPTPLPGILGHVSLFASCGKSSVNALCHAHAYRDRGIISAAILAPCPLRVYAHLARPPAPRAPRVAVKRGCVTPSDGRNLSLDRPGQRGRVLLRVSSTVGAQRLSVYVD